jgi:hypothetical protein
MSSRQRRGRPESFAEFITNEARYAIRDIRQKLFEEAWFGRAVTDTRAMDHKTQTLFSQSHETLSDTRIKFEVLWGSRRPEADDKTIDPDKKIDR